MSAAGAHDQWPALFRFVRHLPGRCHGAAHGTGRRAGVGQTSGEETAGRATVVRSRYCAMAIVVRCRRRRWPQHGLAAHSYHCPARQRCCQADGPSLIQVQGIQPAIGKARLALPKPMSARSASGGSRARVRSRRAPWTRWRTDRVAAHEGLQDDHCVAAVPADEDRWRGDGHLCCLPIVAGR